MPLRNAVPGLPTSDMDRAIAFYQDQLGFHCRHHEPDFAILNREAVELHLWLANDESWKTRSNQEPVCSGAESFIAGTSGCRIEVDTIDELYAEYQGRNAVRSDVVIVDEPWGMRDFVIFDPDGNLITFYMHMPSNPEA